MSANFVYTFSLLLDSRVHAQSVATGLNWLYTGYVHPSPSHDRSHDWLRSGTTVTEGPVITAAGSVQSRLFSGYHNLTCNHYSSQVCRAILATIEQHLLIAQLPCRQQHLSLLLKSLRLPSLLKSLLRTMVLMLFNPPPLKYLPLKPP